MMRGADYSRFSECPSRRRKLRRAVDGEEIVDRQGVTAGQIPGPGGQSLQTVWPQPGVYAEVWRVSDLLPGAGLRGQASWRDEIELVGSPARSGWRRNA